MAHRSSRDLRDLWGAASWAACAQFFLAEAVATLGFQGHYSYRDKFISDLGALTCLHGCSHWHALMNSSFVLQAVLIAAGTLLLSGRFFPTWAGATARVFLLLSAVGVLLVGLFPEDANANFHVLGARMHFLLGALAMLLIAIAHRRRAGSPRHARPDATWLRFQPVAGSIAASIALFGDVLIAYSNEQTAAVLGTGTIERIAAYPFPLWLALTGSWTLWAVLAGGNSNSPRDAAPTARNRTRDL
ncbi:DUF998 domain-containing protein [Acidipila sp. EB88]|uniref:DUF998 domain-containing protein n=1 Tax=Acidipila sp. EB88 TaxID=2305226 RepID=UPI000F5E4B38|nr:DUF998 domain-containing protein [Acidipila sp. EB88]RRA47755.1 DUF998 domain-containing protein [Acidipila sp. EB88]